MARVEKRDNKYETFEYLDTRRPDYGKDHSLYRIVFPLACSADTHTTHSKRTAKKGG